MTVAESPSVQPATGHPAAVPRHRSDAGVAERVRRFSWRLDTTVGLVAIFALGLAVRLLIAPHTGYYADLKIFQHWAERLGDVGLRGFYAEDWADYPPGYLYILWVLNKVASPPGYLLLKLPAIVGDLALAWIAAIFAERLAPAELKQRWPLRPLVACAVLFNPAVIMVGAVWGQVDVVPAVFVLWSLLLLFTGAPRFRRELAAFALYGVAVSMKPQAGFVLPIMAYALYLRHLRAGRAALGTGAGRIAADLAAFLAVLVVSALPFGLTPVELVRFYNHAASMYPFTSANAFNVWGIVGFWRRDSPGAGDFVDVAGIAAVHIGMLAFAAAIVVVLWRLHRNVQTGADVPRALAVSAAATSLLAFALLTRMHERYMFYALAFLTPLIFVRALRYSLGALSLLYVLNLWWVYAYNNSRGDLGRDVCALPAPGCYGFDWVFGGFTMDTWQKKLFSVAVTLIAIAIAWHGVAWATSRVRARRQAQVAG